MIILNRTQIEALIDLPMAAAAIESAYRASSRGEVNLPPVGHITFPQGADCHIKYGHMKGDAHFVIKIATGFPQNDAQGLATGNGVVMVLSAVTGQVQAMLHDEMMLTDVRTGLGGAIATRALARPDSRRVLVTGTGQQARHQIKAHVAILGDHLSFQIWGRDAEKAQKVAGELSELADVAVTRDLPGAVQTADIIIATTGSTEAYLMPDWVGPGTHITAVGADAPGKQELEVELVTRADVLIVDSVSQCLDHGEVSHAAKLDLVRAADLRELGAVLLNPKAGRRNDAQISIADLTGIAAQDIAMAKSVLEIYSRREMAKP